jgi:hypothetical protein
MSLATITVTGAAMVFCTLAGASAERNRSLLSFVRRNNMRTGQPFMLVGPAS